MSIYEVFQRYGKFILYAIYPLTGGIVFAMLVSSVVFYRTYRPVVRMPVYKPAKAQKKFNVDRAVAEILNKNVINLKITEGRKNNGKETKHVPIENVKLLGVFLGKEKMAILKSGNELVYLKPGEDISGYRIASIEFDRVVLKKAKREFVLTFPENKPSRSSKYKAYVDSIDTGEVRRKAQKIVIKRKEIVEKSKDINKLLTTVRIVPYYKLNEFLGYRLAMLKKESFFYRLGLRAGDVIQRVNGEDVSSPERLIEMLSKLESITAVNIDLIRRGKRKTIFIEIED